jgi:Family of unknown function (DUF5989)
LKRTRERDFLIWSHFLRKTGDTPGQSGADFSGNGPGAEMKRFVVPIAIVVMILVGLVLLTEGSAIAPFLYRKF